jgi:hypothetical protein
MPGRYLPTTLAGMTMVQPAPPAAWHPGNSVSVEPSTNALRLPATLVALGEVLFILVGLLHPAHENPNNHPAVFVEYAASTLWGAVHLGQFLTMALILAGLASLYVVLDIRAGWAGQVARLASTAILLTLALTAVLQAVDAWAQAPAADQAARFATAEAMRWLEWAVRSYQRLMLGITLGLSAALVVSSTRLPRPIGYAMAISSLAYVAQGILVGAEGFAADSTAPQLLALVADIVWTGWLAITAWSTPSTIRQPSGRAQIRP